MKKMEYFDIYGFKIKVLGNAEKKFLQELSFFRKKSLSRFDLFVKPSEEDLPTKQKGSNFGIKLPFGDTDKILLYNEEVENDFLFYMAEPLIEWKNKCFLHCGAIEKAGKALVFPAWSGVGKTRIVMAAIKKGWRYLSDDRLIVGEGKAFPYPKPLHIFDYNLRDKKVAKKVLGKKSWFYLPLFRLINFLERNFKNRFFRILVDRFRPSFSVPLKKLEPSSKIAPTSIIEKFIFLTEDPLKKITSSELAEKMSTVNDHEKNHFYLEYQRYVFQKGKSKKIEGLKKREKEIMKKTFSAIPLGVLQKKEISSFLSKKII
jgi:hypothetical protein